MATGSTTQSKATETPGPAKSQDGKDRPAPQPVFRDYASI
jgi:hypothetical protein